MTLRVPSLDRFDPDRQPQDRAWDTRSAASAALPPPGPPPQQREAAIEVRVAHSVPLIEAGLMAVLGAEDDLLVRPLHAAAGVDHADGRRSPERPRRVLVADRESALSLLAGAGASRPAGARAPILMVTRLDGDGEIANALGAGADGYFVLGAPVSELIDAVRALAHGGRYFCDSRARRVAEPLPRELAEAPRRDPPTRRPIGGLPPGALQRVREHMEQRLCDKLELCELAAIARLSACHFSRAFKQSVGMPPHRYLMLRRVHAAATLITQTDRTLTEISLEVGFADQSHFTRTFSRTVGQTPREFRHRHR